MIFEVRVAPVVHELDILIEEIVLKIDGQVRVVTSFDRLELTFVRLLPVFRQLFTDKSGVLLGGPPGKKIFRIVQSEAIKS